MSDKTSNFKTKKQRLFKILLLGLLLSSPTLFAQSDKQKKLEAQRQQILREMKQFKTLLINKGKEEKSEITLIENLNYKINRRENLIKITNQQANLLTREISTNEKEIASLKNQLDVLKKDYAAMVVKSYKSKSEQSKVMFLLSSDNFRQAYKRLQYIRQYANYQKEQGEAIKTKTKALEVLNTQLLKQKSDKQKLIEENRVSKRELEKIRKEREILMASIKADMSRFAAKIKKKRQEADRLDREINRLIREAIAASNKKAGKKTSTGKYVLTPADKIVGNNFEVNKGRLGWPVSRGVVKSKFGKTKSLTDGSILVNNSGIKIVTESNAKVKTVFKGEVSSIIVVKNGNQGVMIRHGNYFTIYYNLSKVNVRLGDKVSAGQVIGEIFTSPINGESLLDFRIYKNNQKLNPQYWLVKH